MDERGQLVPHNLPTREFARSINGFDPQARRQVAEQIHALLETQQSLLPIEEEVRDELEAYAKGECVFTPNNLTITFWRAARIVRNRSLAPDTMSILTRPIWHLLNTVVVPATNTPPQPTLRDRINDLAREAADRQRRPGSTPSNSQRDKKRAREAGEEIGSTAAETFLSRQSSTGSSSSGGGFWSNLIDSIFGYVKFSRR